jgi:hypothetical protein
MDPLDTKESTLVPLDPNNCIIMDFLDTNASTLVPKSTLVPLHPNNQIISGEAFVPIFFGSDDAEEKPLVTADSEVTEP